MRDWARDRKNLRKEILLLILGVILYDLSNLWILSVDVVAGSVLGVANLLYRFQNIPVGTSTLIINLPIMYFCVRRFGEKVLIYTGFFIIASSLLMNVMLPWVPYVNGVWGVPVAVIAGGVNGLACGLLMRAGGSAGGTTAIVRVLKSHFPKLNVTVTMFLTDAIVFVLGAFLMQKVSAIFLSVALSLSASFFVDMGYTWGRKDVDVV